MSIHYLSVSKLLQTNKQEKYQNVQINTNSKCFSHYNIAKLLLTKMLFISLHWVIY